LLQGAILIGPLQMTLFKIEVIYRGASIWPTFIGYESSTLGKKNAKKCGLIANISGTHVGNLRTSLGTWWEHQDPKKWNLQPPSPKEKKSVSSPLRHQKLGKTQLHMHMSFNPKKT
jgi:hypothetical protein